MMLKTSIFTHHPRISLARFYVLLMTSQSIGDDVAMTSQWPDNCDANMWQVRSNSLDIDFIHGNIHGRSCKKLHFLILFPNSPMAERSLCRCCIKMHSLTHCGLVMSFGDIDLVQHWPDSTQLLPDPMLTNHWGPVPFTWVQFQWKSTRYRSLISVWKLLI